MPIYAIINLRFKSVLAVCRDLSMVFRWQMLDWLVQKRAKGHMNFKFWHRAPLSRIGKDERGSIMVQAVLYIAVSIGLTGLALDGGRFLMLNNSLQDLADAAALAGAAQLDGAQDAQTRATAAAQAIANRNAPHSWYYDSGGSTAITTAFYKSLNPDAVAGGPKDLSTSKSLLRPRKPRQRLCRQSSFYEFHRL